MRKRDRRLQELARELRALVEQEDGHGRSGERTAVSGQLAALSEAIERRGWTRRERTAPAPVLAVLGAAGLIGAAALWLAWDASRRQRLSEWREARGDEVRDAIHRARGAAERAMNLLPAEAEEARQLVQQTADGLEEALNGLRASWQRSTSR